MMDVNMESTAVEQVTAKRMRLFVIDDHALFREGLVRLLQNVPDFEVCGQSPSVREALSEIPKAQPDMILLDVDLGSERGLDIFPSLRDKQYNGKVLVVTGGVTDREAVQLIQAGASGILHKHKAPEELCDAIRQVARGEVYLDQHYLKPLFHSVESNEGKVRRALSDREVRILRLIFQGMANKEIAEQLNLTESTVKAALRVLFDKLGVRTRSQLVKVALEQYRDQL
ncbi:MAG: response regulator transcription factor [Bryobacterales bacterium]|nr:response regulator transcription factor [Bryobacterales bacterium]